MKDAYYVSRRVIIERWENCLRVLQNLTPHERRKHWSMGTWGEKTECGTIACAAGHCALDPWFKRRGLKQTFKKNEMFDGTIHWTSDFDDDLVEIFFGSLGTYRIFYDTDRRPVSTVIKEVKAYIKELKKMDKGDWANNPEYR